MAKNLLRKVWSKLDSHELRLLLLQRIGGPGQYEDQQANPNKFCFPLAGDSCQVAVTYRDDKIVGVEPGKAFDAAVWQEIANEIEKAILVGPAKLGREYSFSSFRVEGSWRGSGSGLQILPPPSGVPTAPFELAAHPFILEFPILAAPDDLWSITNHRRMREHRRLTLLLNVLLRARISFQSTRSKSCWVYVPPADGTGENGESKWLQQWFSAPLGAAVAESPSSATAEGIAEIDAEAYYTNIGFTGNPLCVPTDLDESLGQYRKLSDESRSEFDRAAFWFDLASRQWTMSVSASFASLVTAIESLTGRGTQHRVFCEQCQSVWLHEVPGATKRFWSFVETYAPGAALLKARKRMYDLRSGISHGSKLMQMDEDLGFGWGPPDHDEQQLQTELWSITRLALRNWLKTPRSPSDPASAPLPA
jgi:hypothetical protein